MTMSGSYARIVRFVASVAAELVLFVVLLYWVTRLFPATGVGLALAFLLLGSGALGACGRLGARPQLEPCAVVMISTLMAMTLLFRAYVLDYVVGAPSFWRALEDTGPRDLPYALGLALVSLLGWHAMALVLRHRPAGRARSRG